jgi:carboxylesterase type B
VLVDSGQGFFGLDHARFDEGGQAGGGLVVVSINYRMAAEGFVPLDGAPANRGFLDQIAALEWVQRNIAAFGADPDRVTVAGQSAGAGSIAALLTMKRARGLFGRAIAHSVPGLLCTPALAKDVAATLADRVRATPDAEALARVDPLRLADELAGLGAELPGHRVRWGRLSQLGVAVCPVLDGVVLTETPWRALAGDGGQCGWRGRNRAACRTHPRRIPVVQRHYGPATAPASGGILGGCHSLDVPLAFGTLNSPTGCQLFGGRPTPQVAAVSRELLQAWVRFATTGDPGWPAYRPWQRLTRVPTV